MSKLDLKKEVASLKLCKKLATMGIPHDDSYYWIKTNDDDEYLLYSKEEVIPTAAGKIAEIFEGENIIIGTLEDCEYYKVVEKIPAYHTTYLLDILPQEVRGYSLVIHKTRTDNYWVGYKDAMDFDTLIFAEDKILANALAKLYIGLLKYQLLDY